MTDIVLSIVDQPIKNGSTIVGCAPTGRYSELNTNVTNKPSIDTIASKYDNRFDDRTYYQGGGGGSINGGTYTGNDINGGGA
jgi:hypothetical protein